MSIRCGKLNPNNYIWFKNNHYATYHITLVVRIQKRYDMYANGNEIIRHAMYIIIITFTDCIRIHLVQMD